MQRKSEYSKLIIQTSYTIHNFQICHLRIFIFLISVIVIENLNQMILHVKIVKLLNAKPKIETKQQLKLKFCFLN